MLILEKSCVQYGPRPPSPHVNACRSLGSECHTNAAEFLVACLRIYSIVKGRYCFASSMRLFELPRSFFGLVLDLRSYQEIGHCLYGLRDRSQVHQFNAQNALGAVVCDGGSVHKATNLIEESIFDCLGRVQRRYGIRDGREQSL